MNLFIFVNKVLAGDPVDSAGGGVTGSGLTNPLGNIQTVQALIVKILNLIVQIGLPVIVLMIVFAGFKYVMARGNETEIKAAHETILWTVIGAAVVLGAAVISKAICGTINTLGGTNSCN